MSLHKKYLPMLSLISVLLAAAAAPYMIPTSPDSLIFRSGIAVILLLFGCYSPVHEAYTRAPARTLVSGFVWGLLFALALSVGSELAYYDHLLTGMGSTIRRISVPLMITPLLGGMCARAMMARLTPRREPLRIPLLVYAAVFFVCWLPLLLAYYPGMLNYDFKGVFSQYTDGLYSSIHPVLHSVLTSAVIGLGELLHSRTFGVLLLSLLQMILFALSLAYACVFAQRRGVPRPVMLGITALFALHPVFSVMSLSMTKDTLFAAAVLVLSLLTWELIEAPDDFFSSRKKLLFYAFVTVNAGLMRNNGVFVLLLLFPATIAVMRGRRARTAILCAASAGLTLLVLGVLNLVYQPEKLPSFQLYSVPAQQLVRAYNTGRLSEEDAAELRSWYVDEAGLSVHPHLSDGAKGYLDKPRIQQEGGEFLDLWARLAPEFAWEYTEAFLMLNIGSWYPDDLSHSTIYPDASWNDKGYLQTQEYDMREQGLETTCFLPGVRDFYERICRRNRYQKYPIISLLFCTATPFWVILFACALLVSRRRSRCLPAALGVLGLWGSYLFGPCTLPRYILPLFCLAPVLLAVAYTLPHADRS